MNDTNATVDGTSLPGGVAGVSLGPVAEIVTWQRRTDVSERQWVAAGVAGEGGIEASLALA